MPTKGDRLPSDPPAGSDPLGPTAWTAYADVLLQRAALVMRVDRNQPPDPLAGLKVDDADVDALLHELPGLERAEGPDDGAGEIEASLADTVAEARGRLLGFADGDGEPFARLVTSARLAPPEVELLAVLSAVELDPRRQRLVGYLNDDVTQRRLTPWTVGKLFGPSYVAHTGPGGGLHRAALLTRSTDSPVGSTSPWGSTPLVLAASVVWWLAGDRHPDPDLPPGTLLVAGTAGGEDGLVVAAGSDRIRRLQAVVGGLAAASCLVARLPENEVQWDAVVRAATLGGHGVVLEAGDDLPAEARDRIERTTHLPWALVSVHELPVPSLPRRPWRQAEVAEAAATEAEWAATFPGTERPPYPLTADQLDQVSRSAPGLDGDLQRAVRRLAAGNIDATAARVPPTRTWDDLVLDEARSEQVREIVVRFRHRITVFDDWGFDPQPSTGVVALFAGPSGTGKTLAAEIIAGDLGVDLYKIDLANLVSKYIGETEKNLSKVFDAAEASRVVLFFDEADALLGKRSEVSDAHDRYANIEVAYLLQRLERYDGVAVMATNLAKNIDPAFLRRIHVMVEFPIPGPGERRRIWERSFARGAPLASDLDLGRLADNVEITGGTIRNAALGAAFRAAEAGTDITMALAVAALRGEMRKIGRLTTDIEL